MTDNPKPPPELDTIARKVLAYRPTPKSKAAKKRRAAQRVRQKDQRNRPLPATPES
jgi:hypothetical protein